MKTSSEITNQKSQTKPVGANSVLIGQIVKELSSDGIGFVIARSVSREKPKLMPGSGRRTAVSIPIRVCSEMSRLMELTGLLSGICRSRNMRSYRRETESFPGNALVIDPVTRPAPRLPVVTSKTHSVRRGTLKAKP
jgi:hypothetical protein